MSATPPHDEPAVPEADHDAERKRLELEKLRLDIEQIKRGNWRALVSVSAPVLLGVATLFVGISGLFLNATINRAAEQQRAFDNYTKLTEQFAKGGGPKLGAMVGLRPFLRPWSDRSAQTVELLVDDLRRERDPATVRAIVYDLVYTGMPAFPRVRDVNVAARDKMKVALIGLLYEQHKVDVSTPFDTIDDILTGDAGQALARAADRYDPDVTQQVRDSRRLGLIRVMLEDAQGYNDEHSYDPSGPKRNPRHWADEYAADAPVFLASVDVLRGLFKQRSGDFRDLDASRIVVLDVDLRDADLQGIDLSNAYLEGHANGADLTGANLWVARLDLDLTRSSTRSTTLCGANVEHAFFVSGLVKGALPDLFATNWVSMTASAAPDVEKTTKKAIEAAYPQPAAEKLAALPPDEKMRLCAGRHFVQGTAKNTAAYNTIMLP